MARKFISVEVVNDMYPQDPTKTYRINVDQIIHYFPSTHPQRTMVTVAYGERVQTYTVASRIQVIDALVGL